MRFLRLVIVAAAVGIGSRPASTSPVTPQLEARGLFDPPVINVPFTAGATVQVVQEDDRAPTPAVTIVRASYNVPFNRVDFDDSGDGFDFDAPSSHTAYAVWIGAAGEECAEGTSSGLVQAGTTSQINSQGVTDSWAWVAWNPAGTTKLSSDDFKVTRGDQIFVSLTIHSLTEATADFYNEDTHKAYSTDISGQALCSGTGRAYWQFEWPASQNHNASWPRAIFNNITITQVVAKGASLGNHNLDTPATHWQDLYESGRHIAQAEKMDHETMRISYPSDSMWQPGGFFDCC